MKAQNHTMLWNYLFRIIVLLTIDIGVSAHAQKADDARCKNASNCIDAGSYTATVTSIIESTTASSRMVRLIIRFENVANHTVILGYRSQSGFLLDNFNNRYFCSQAGQTGPNALDNSAVGIGTDRDNKIDAQFMLKQKQSDSASFDLWRRRDLDQQVSFYDFDVMIDEIDPRDPGTVLSHPFLSFRNLKSKVNGPDKPSVTKNQATP